MQPVACSMLNAWAMELSDSRCIVVAVDFSRTSDIALEQALKLASSLACQRLCVLTVGAAAGDDVRVQFEDRAVTVNEATARALLKQHHARALGEDHSRTGELAVSYHVARGTPGPEVVRFAAEMDADWVVIGTHGRHGLPRALLGSVAEYVVRHAGCSVVAVRPKGHDQSTVEGDPLVAGRAIL